MPLHELERWLAKRGYAFARMSRNTHRLYQNCTGQFVIVCTTGGRPYISPGRVREVFKQVRRHTAAGPAP